MKDAPIANLQSRHFAMAHSIDVIVPVHNRWELTESCLKHLELQTVPHTAIVCDNGSTDRTRERLRASFPQVRVVELDTNLGFSTACNRGVRAGSGEVVVLLNNDVDCRPDFLQRIVDPLDGDERLGSVAALLLYPGARSIESFGLTADRTLASFPRLRNLPAACATTTHPLLVGPCGAGGAYRRSAWEAVGGLDEGVLSYAEDVDLALRLRAAGWSTIGARGAIAIHIGSASATRRSVWQRYQAGFARGYFLRRYGILRSRAGLRAVATEAIVVVADALIFSRDLAALRGRIAGWRAAHDSPRSPRPPVEVIDVRISFLDSLRLRFEVFAGRGPRSLPSQQSSAP
ncbi:MAG: hypothetical protein HW413_53 [Thermoleophilia bacterium]|nr:hypothetical protein [Thermoleophilia bacterium]